MAEQYKVLVNTGKADNNKVLDIQQGVGDRGQPVRIKAQAGAKYELQEVGRKKPVGPDYIKAKRVGKDLHILFEDERQASLIIEDYYEVMPEGYNGVIGQAENGSFYEYIPEDPRVPGLIPELAEGGQAVNVALGGAEVNPVGAVVAFAAFPLLGTLGLLGAGAAAAYYANQDDAAPNNNGVSGKLSSQSDNIDGGDDNDSRTRDNSPTLTGTAPAGSTATVTLNGQTYPVAVNPDGSWTFQQPTNLPDGTYYPILNVTQNGVTTPYNLTPFTIDTVPPAVAITSDAAALAAGQSTTLTFTLSEAVSDFTAADVAVTGGTLSNFQRDPNNPLKYTATFTPEASGTSATISVASDKFSDAAGNANTDGAEADNTLTLATNATVTGALQPAAPNDSGKLGDNLTNDNTPTLAGKVPAGSTAQVVINGQTYPVNVSPDGSWTYTQPAGLPDGTYTPQLIVTPAGSSTPNPAVPLTPFTIDTVPPTVAVVADTNALVSGQTAAVTFTLSEPVADFSAADVAVTGGTLGNFQQSATDPKVWTAIFTPAATGNSATISVASAKFSDAAGNLNADGADANNSVTLATNVSTNGSLSPTSDNAAGIPNDNKTNDNTPELSGKVPAGSAASIVINGQTYPVNVNPDGSWSYTQPAGLPDGTYTPQLIVTPAGSTTPNAPVPITPFTIDTTAPTVAISGSSAPLTAGQSTVLTFTLSEASTDFTDADIQVTGGTLGQLQQSASNPLVYTATFTAAAGSNSASVQVGSYRFSDAAGNLNADGADANNTWSISTSSAPRILPTPSEKTALTIDPIAADNVLLASEQGAGSYTVTGKVTGKFAAGDVVELALNGKIYAAIVAADGSYSVPVAMADLKADPDTKIEGSINPTGGDKATAAQDYTLEAGNTVTQTALSINPVTADNIITAAENTGSMAITGKVTGKFAAGDLVTLTVNGKPFSGAAAADGSYSINVSAADLAADSDTQIDGSVNGSGGTLAKAIQDYGIDTSNTTPPGDTTPPTIIVSRTNPGAALDANSQETIVFTLSEPSTTFAANDTMVTGGMLSGFAPVPSSGTAATGHTQYTAVFTPTASSTGTATIGVASGKFNDNAGNANQDTFVSPAPAGATTEANNQVSLFYNTLNTNPLDNDAPKVQIGVDKASLAAGQSATLTLILSEPSSDFTLSDITVISGGGTLSNLLPVPGSNGAQYTATYTAGSSAGSVRIGVAEGTFKDAAGNVNTDTYKGSVAGTNAVSGTSAEADNWVQLTNTGASDTTAPTIAVSRAGSGTVGATGETVYFTLSEPSANFVQADVDVTGGTLSNWTQLSPTQYSATFTPAAASNGTATIGVAAGKFTDAASNQNLDTYSSTDTVAGRVVETNNLVTLGYDTRTTPVNPVTPDTTAPSIAITASQSTLSSGQTSTVTFTLSEASADFTQSDVTVTGGSLSGWTQVNPTTWSATYTPTAGTQGTGSVRVDSNTFRDAANNYNQDGAEANNEVDFITNYGNNPPAGDTTPPTIIVSRTNAGTTLAAGTNETIVFTLSEASLDFSAADVTVTGGTLSNFTPVPNSGTPATGYTQYTASFNPTANSAGVGTVSVAAGTFRDNAGNQNLDTYSGSPDTVSGRIVQADNQVSLNYNTVPADNTPPVVALSRKGSGMLAAGGSDQITFTLSEASTTFSQADVDVVGGTLTNFTPVIASGDATRGYTQYSATFTPSANSNGQQLARIGVQSGKFTDTAGNQNLDTYVTGVSGTTVEANNVIDITYNTQLPDTSAPTIIVTRAAAGTVSTSETIYFTLSEASTTFALSDVDVSGGTLSNFAPVVSSGTSSAGYTQYSATFTPSANSAGVATVGVKSGTFTDAAGNPNADTYVNPAPSAATYEDNNQISLGYNTLVPDTTRPTIAISRAGTGVVTGNETISFTLSEPSTNFVATDVDVVGGTLTNFAPDPSTGNASTGYTGYTATFVPASNTLGSASVAVASSKFTDAASNNNLDTYIAGLAGTTQEANNIVSFQVNTDTTAPTIAIARANGQTNQTFTGPETLNFTLSEASSDFTAADVAVIGGTLSNFAGSGTSYSATFTPTPNASGTVTIGVAAGTFRDAAGNQNLDTYSGSTDIVSGRVVEVNNLITAPFNTDSTPPTVIVSRTSGASGALSSPESFTFTFSEAINPASFVIGDIDATGGTITSLTPVSSSGSASTGYTQYTATFAPAANTSTSGSVAMAAGKFTDMSGNRNLDTYSAGADTVPGHQVETNNIVSFQVNTTAPDTTAPTVIVTRAGNGTVTSTEMVFFNLSEPAKDFDASDIVTTGGTLSGFAPVTTSGNSTTGYTQYSATFTPSANSLGTATVSVASGKFTDAAANQNLDTYSASVSNISGFVVESNNQVSFAYNTDTTAPTILVERQGSSTVTGPITVSFTLSESSTNFTLDDIDAVGGTVSNLQGSGTSYTATFTPMANAVGTASVGVASNKFNDAAGNANLDTYLTGVAGTTTEGANTTGANIVVFQYATDTTRPTVAISSNKSTLALGDTAVLTLQFNEPVTDITTSDFTLSGGTITNLVAVAGTNNTVYTATYTPAPNSTANSVISIASDKFSDAAGNFNNDGADANNTVTMTTNTVAPDTTAPTILVQSSVTSLLAGQTSLITFTLSEASSNFADTDVVVTGGTIGQFQQSGTNPLVYTAVFTPTPNSTTPASVLVPSLSFSDAAGNNNVDGADTGPTNTNIVNMTVNTVVPDTTRPTVAISSNKSTLALGDTAVLTLVFSEPVTDIAVADFTLSGGSIAGLSAVPGTNNTVYQATYTPAPNSTANSVISIASDKFSDAAGNFNADGADANNTVTMTTNTMPAISLVNDTATVGEAGGVANGTAGAALASTVSGVSALNVLANDTSATSVTGVSAGTTNGTMGQNLVGQYGTLVMNANGSYTYAVDNTNATVQALRGSSNTLTEVFSYTASDGSTSRSANLTITITGTNDAPVAVADTTTAVEAGGSANGTAGTNPSGNVLTNDTDVDSGDTKTVSAIAGGTLGSAKAGSYGSLTLNADGSYSYVVDNANASVQALRTSANTLTDTFTYTVQDAAGATSTATLTVTVQGANDAPTVATTVSNKTGTVGTALSSFTGPTFADVDTVTNETATVTATLANGQPLSSIGLSYNASTNTFSGTPTAAGTYTLLVTDTDAGGLTAQTTFDIVIASPILPTTTITQINGDGAPLAAPTLTITDATTGTAANSAATTFTFTFDQAVKGFTAGDVTITDSNGGSLTLTPTGTWADGQTVYTGTVTAPASGAGAYAVTVADGSYQSNSGNVPGYGNSNVQAYAASQDGYSSTASTTSGGNGDVGVSIALSNGNYIWSTNMGSGGLSNVGKAQIFNSSGGLITSSLTVPTGFLSPAAAGNVSTTYYVGANNTSYAALPGGGFVVAYTDDGAGNNYSASIWVVKYDNNGTMVSTSTQANTAVVTNAYGSPGASSFFGTTSITPTANGNYALTYARATTAGDPTNAAIYAVEIDGSTNAIVAGRTPSLISAASFDTVAINGMDATTLADGKIVVSWAQEVPDGVFTRVLNADGTPLAGSNVMQSLSTANQYDTINTIATPDGGFVIVSADQTVANNAGYGVIKAIKYTVSGSTVTPGTVTTVSTANVSGTDNNKNPAAAVLTNGNIVVTWENERALSGAFYRIYDANLNPISPARSIPGTALSGSTQTANTLSHTVVTALPDGGFVIGVSGSGTTPTGVNTQQVFFSADGAAISRTGSTASDTQIGGDGADTLTGGGGADVILAGAGNDTVVINASNISNLTTAGRLLDGGTGIDTLRMGADASTLDLSKSAIQANVQNFEKIDLGSDAVVNTVILNASAVQRLATQNLDGTSSNKQLIIDGTSSDLVKLSGQWNNGIQAGYWQQSSTTPTRTVGGVTYKVYTISGLSGVEVLVNNAITSANTDVAYQMASGDIITLPNTSVIVGDLETTSTGGSTGTGDGGSQQPANLSSTTSDTSPLVQGTLSQALTGTQVLKLYRTNVTDGGAAVEVSANVTTSGTNWQFQDSGLVAGKQYRYEARIMDGSTLVDASNTYTINQASATAPDTTPPTVAVSRSGSNTMTGAETITFTLSEASTDFAVDDVVFSGGTLTNFAGSGTTYTATFTPTANSTGTFQVGVQASAFKDAAGNFNTDDYRNTGAENTNNQVTDSFNTQVPLPTSLITQINADGAPTVGPTLTITDNNAGIAANSASTTFTFTFSAPVSNFVQGDVTFIDSATGATLTPTSFSGSGSTYTAAVAAPASGNGQILVRVNDGVADLTSNTAVKSTGNSWSQVYGASTDGFTTADTGTTMLGAAGRSVTLTNGNRLYLSNIDDWPGQITPAGNMFTVHDPYGSPISVAAAPLVSYNARDVAVLPNGEFTIFTDSASTTSRQFTTFYANGQQKSMAPVSFSLPTAASTFATAVTTSGNYVVVYADATAGNQAYYWKIINGTTGADVTAPIQLSTTGSVTSTSSPGESDLVRLSDGRIAMVWTTLSGAGGYQILNADGTTNTAVSTFTSSATSGVRNIDTTALANGGFAVTTFGYDSASKPLLELNIYSAQGARGSTINVINDNYLYAYNSPVVQLSNGNIAVAYDYDANANGSTYGGANKVFVKIYDSSTGALLNTIAASGTGSNAMDQRTNASTLDLAPTADGGFYLTYQRTDGAIVERQFDSAGSSVGTTSATSGASLAGGDGADTISALGTNQIVVAGAGDDTVKVNSTAVSSLTSGAYLDGGSGFDTLSLSGTGITLDLADTAVSANVKGFEVIQLGTAGSNTLNLNVSAAMALATGSPTTLNQLFVRGDATDLLNLSPQYNNGSITGSWSAANGTTTVNGVTYKVYTYSGDTSFSVYVESAITSVTTNAATSNVLPSLPSGTVVVGDVQNVQQATPSDTTTDTTPLIQGNLSSALGAGQTLKLYRTNMTDNATETLVATLTPSGVSNAWTYQELTALTTGKQYKYVARVSDGTQSADSNAYSIDVAASGIAGGGGSGAGGSTSDPAVIAPTLTITDNQPSIAANASTVKFTFNFSEPVVGFDATDVTVTNGTKGTFTTVSSSQYTLDVTLPTSGVSASGTALVSVAPGSFTDATSTAGIGATATQQYGGSTTSTFYQASSTANANYGYYGSSVKLSNGNYVLIGSADNGGATGNKITLFDANGTVLAQSSLTSTILGADNSAQPVAMANGEFAVFYKGGFTLFNAAGAVKQVDTAFTTADTTVPLEAAQLGNGDLAVIYGNNQVGNKAIYYKVIHPDGSVAVAETALSATGFCKDIYYRVTATTLNDGKVAMIWENGSEGGYVYLSSTGTQVSPPTSFATGPVTPTPTVADIQAIPLLSGGMAEVSYIQKSSNDSYPAASDFARGVMLTLYGADGSRGRSLQVEFGNYMYTDASVAQLSNGNLVVVYGYSVNSPSNSNTSFAQIFTPDGTFVEKITLPTQATNTDALTVTALADNAFAVTLATGGVPTQYIYKTTSTGVSQTGTSAADVLSGGDGADTLTGLGGADKIYAGAGDDSVVLNDDNVTQLGTGGSGALVDGGAGVDMLKLSGSGITLDLTNATLGPRVTNFEKFDITGSGANVFKLNASDVLHSNMTVGNATHVVQIDGDGNDIVNLNKLFDGGTTTGTWSTSTTTTISGTTYNVYNYSGDATLQVFIDNQITQVTLS